jgi:hypothetical protein
VLSELIRTLPVAVLVGVVPGFFWSKCLAPSADSVERIAYSTALSMALVPTVALLMAGVFDVGITYFLCAVCVAVVFATGLVAFLLFGEASSAEKPVFDPPPEPPSVYALVPLSAALALGLIPGSRYALLVAAPLLLLAGAIGWFVSRPPSPRTSRGTRWPLASSVLIVATLLVTLVRGYLGPVVHDWPSIRGGDQYSHAVMTHLMLTEGSSGSYLIYPPGFHALMALISGLSGLEPLEIFPVLAPALSVLAALACYALARRMWGRSYAVAAGFFSGVLLVGTYESLAEARYPNFVSANFLIVLAVAALIGVYVTPGVRSVLLFGALGSSVVLYHQVATLYLALLLALVAVISLPYLLLARRKRTAIGLSLSLSLLALLSILYAWPTYDLPGLVGGSGTGAGKAVSIAIGSQDPLSLEHSIEMTSQPVAWLGALGVLLAVGDLLRGRLGTPQTLTYLTLLSWVLLLFAGSRTSLSGFPQRFERDLGIPLAVFAALSFILILRSREASTSLARLVAIPAAALALVAVGLQAAENLSNADAPSSNVISAEVIAAGEWLRDHHTEGNIVVTPYLNDHVPGSAMLAMGGYSGLRSYPQRSLRNPRALPSSGKEPLLAAAWVLRHPVGERTASILDEYDIRYVSLYKRSPGVHWRAFENQTGLYRLVFENDSVVIFAPRNASSRTSSDEQAQTIRRAATSRPATDTWPRPPPGASRVPR